MWVYEEALPTGEKLTDVINLNNVMFCRFIMTTFHFMNFRALQISDSWTFINRRMLSISLV